MMIVYHWKNWGLASLGSQVAGKFRAELQKEDENG
jgi:hypothetical protein